MPRTLPEDIKPRCFNAQRSAVYLGVSYTMLRQMIKLGVITPLKMPGIGRLMFDRLELDALANAQSKRVEVVA